MLQGAVRRAWLAGPIAVTACLLAASTALAQPRMTVEGSQFRVAAASGDVLPQERLPGVEFTLADGGSGGGGGIAGSVAETGAAKQPGDERRLRIDAAERDPNDASGETMLYTLSERGTDGAWSNVCMAGPDGRRQAFPLSGSFDAEGNYHPAPDRFLITCTAGAEGKCVRFGYKPWRATSDGVSLAPYYQTCVRMVRADYGGDGIGHTRNGTTIDLFDRIGIQADDASGGLSFEAAFAPDGAVCVAHPRWADLIGLAELAARYPRLVGRLGAGCDERAPALIYVRSAWPSPPPPPAAGP